MKCSVKVIVASFVLFFTPLTNAMIIDWEGTGVDFYMSWLDEDTMRVEIDAGNITAGSGWDGAIAIDSIAINSDAYTWSLASDILLDGPGGSFDGGVDGSGLNASGCEVMVLGGNHPCFSGYEFLTDDMFFDFTFANLVSYADAVHLKVRFVDDQGEKIGSLLSTDVGTRVSVLEPSSGVLLGLGIFALAMIRRRLH